ncbi:hypothetical protein EJ02DRAFT_354494 [Clathrospora elynae]|uniref:PiggyBac transposable element-derived protein domain-containing protein n=1 Tax=Clathrospora elynae TaxID=706981 RepID=A0A6A5SFP4_9PLEO|nr:hypothetical protein EJ02DRAFT_354494 [Clathrospora elynae]
MQRSSSVFICTVREKLEPRASAIKAQSKATVTPGSRVSINEMMIRQTGRSVHTYLVHNKPVPVGFKVHTLCKAGYCYTWMLDSLLLEAPAAPDQADVELSDTAKQVVKLALELPWHSYPNGYCVFLDNAYTSIWLFYILQKYGIACCGTTRAGQKDCLAAHRGIQRVKEKWA